MQDRTFIRASLATAALAMGLAFTVAVQVVKAEELAAAGDVVVVTQTGCQFIEAENGADRGYLPRNAADCLTINELSGSYRIAEARPIELKAGRYIFRVVNRDVPYEVGFWLRASDYETSSVLDKLTKTSITGAGLTPGKSRDYIVDLAPGEYVYSCPLNPTPSYTLVVRS